MQFTASVLRRNSITVDKEIIKAYNIKQDDQIILELIKVIRTPIKT